MTNIPTSKTAPDPTGEMGRSATLDRPTSAGIETDSGIATDGGSLAGSTWPATVNRSAPAAVLLPTFGLTLFLSATLLFMVQPMIGKMILPVFGGTAAVWNTCMLFFQAVLLLGYSYAHFSTVWLGVRKQAALHLVVLLVPLLALPIVVSMAGQQAAHLSPIMLLLGKLTVAVGLPFFVVSTTGPLLQRWFAQTGHRSASDPYFLYGASNAGSLLALLGYPLLIQPMLTLEAQGLVWTAGYVALVAAIAVCTLLLWRSGRARAAVLNVEIPLPSTESSSAPSAKCAAAQSPTAKHRAWWVFTAFVPSSLMLGVTAHITSNLAPVPLLWVMPLAIYLLTFVLVFARKPIVPHATMVGALPFLVLPLAVLTFLELPGMAWVSILAQLSAFFVATMVCHGELAKSRPNAMHLTEFYMWMSVGGVLGGVFNAIIAPAVFTSVVEYPVAIVLSCLLLPLMITPKNAAREKKRDLVFPLVYAAVALAALWIYTGMGIADSYVIRAAIFGPLAIVCFSFKDRPVRFALSLAVFFAGLSYYCGLERGTPLYAGRNFFGVKLVVEESDGSLRKLIHGTTNHGMQFTDAARSGEPLAYYHRTGPLGDVFAGLRGTEHLDRVGIIGLGAGAIAAYAEPGQAFTFYEIDPEVEQIAKDPRFFSFLADCKGKCDVVLGDGRLTIANECDGTYGLIVLDAFSSDAIPTHLLTREALQLYLSKLAPGGVLAFHMSNRYLDLEPLLQSLAADAGLAGLAKRDVVMRKDPSTEGKSPAHYVVLARRDADLAFLAGTEWKPLRSAEGRPVWSDQHTSILPYICWR